MFTAIHSTLQVEDFLFYQVSSVFPSFLLVYPFLYMNSLLAFRALLVEWTKFVIKLSGISEDLDHVYFQPANATKQLIFKYWNWNPI